MNAAYLYAHTNFSISLQVIFSIANSFLLKNFRNTLSPMNMQGKTSPTPLLVYLTTHNTHWTHCLHFVSSVAAAGHLFVARLCIFEGCEKHKMNLR